MKRIFSIFSIIIALAAWTPAVQADERILSFHSDITVNADSSLNVTETIQVRAEGDQIKRGIYRDFPTRYPLEGGRSYVVGFDLLDVKRDGREDGYHTENVSNGVRIYIGKKEVFLNPGPYTYTIRYRTTGQLGNFHDHDELYWNVTGNGWVFPIDNASASVHLPAGIPTEQIQTKGFTGSQGSKETQYTQSSVTDGAVEMQAARGLGSYEGFTIVVGFPKGHVQEIARDIYVPPPPPPRRDYLLFIAVVLLFSYYLLAWWKVGMDPDKGTVIPIYYPPQDFTGDEVRYLSRMGYDKKAFTCMIVHLAVKGAVMIEDRQNKIGPLSLGGSYILRRQDPPKPLVPEESAFLNELLPMSGSELILDNSNHARIQEAISDHKNRVQKAVNKIYYLSNLGFVSGGIALGLAIFAMTMYFIPNFGPANVFIAWFMILILTVIFSHLMKAPTLAGRSVLDKIEGFKMFLSATEKEQLKWLDVPEKTPQLYEAYLPYAIAMDVEDKWSRQFTAILAAAVAAGYAPSWYSGNNRFNSRSFADDLGGNFSRAIAASAQAPGSSSGFSGGGSSGGGGGGGGGGGW